MTIPILETREPRFRDRSCKTKVTLLGRGWADTGTKLPLILEAGFFDHCIYNSSYLQSFITLFLPPARLYRMRASSLIGRGVSEIARESEVPL